MNRPLAFLAALAPVVALAAEPAPLVISHHGRLLDSADQPVTTATTITFELHALESAPQAGDDEPVWTETDDVLPVHGLYHVDLGAKTPLPATAFSQDRWLQIVIGTTKLTPRLRIGSVPFAVRALTLGDKTAADFAPAVHDHDAAYYPRAEADATFAKKGDAYLKSETYSKTEAEAAFYPRADADAAFAPKATTYTKTEADAQYAPKGTTYTKTDVDSTFATKAALQLTAQQLQATAAAMLPSQSGVAPGSVLVTNGTAASWEATGGPGGLVRLGADGKLPALDGSRLVNLPANLGGNPVATTAPRTGDMLTWDGGKWVPTKPPSFGTSCEPGSMVTGINADGTLQCYQQKGFSKVQAGVYHSCAIVSDNTVRCWGYGADGRLGNKSTVNQFKPVSVKTLGGILSNVIDLSAGYQHTCAIVGTAPDSTQGSVWCWGYNGNGQLGDNSTTSRNYAVQAGTFTNAVQVTAGYRHTCARLATGGVKCWGYNGNRELGNNGSTTQSLVPVDVTLASNVAMTDAQDVSAGYAATCIVRATGGGSAWCWGYNGYGQLGDGTTTARPNPTQVSGMTSGVTKIQTSINYWYSSGAATYYFYDSSCALKAGELWCWGQNSFGQLGDGTTVQKTAPVKVQVDVLDNGTANGGSGGVLTGVTDFALGGIHACAIAAPNNTAYCWGYDGNRQTSTAAATGNRTRPVPIRDAADSDTLQNVVSLAVSKYYTGFSLFLTQDPDASTGTALGMGYNGYGNLGDGTTNNTSGPPIYVTAP